MKLQADEEFARFVQRRARLNEQLDSARDEIDSWIQEHLESDVTVTELGQLEGLLKVRSDHLTELAALDDSFMIHLIELLNTQRTRGSG